MNERTIREACEKKFHDLLPDWCELQLELNPSCKADIVYRLIGGSSEARIGVDVHRRIRPADVGTLETVREAGGCAAWMVFSEFVTDSVGHRLREHGLWYVDVQGNAFIELPGEFLVRVSGNRPRQPVTPKGQHFSVPGAKALHFLLKHGPRIAGSYRDIREATGVSIDKIGKLIRELKRDGTVRVHGSGDYEAADGKRMIRLWDEAFESKLGPALDLGSYRCPTSDFGDLVERAIGPLGDRIVVGGEVAADVHTKRLRPARLRLYVPESLAAAVRRKLQLAPSESGPVQLCRLYSTEIGGEQQFHGARAADVAFVYAELMASGEDRLTETAMRLREEFLAWTL